jgi:glycosyltransferase 2 family protein
MPSPTAETPGGGGLLDGPLPTRRGRWWWVPGTVLLIALVAFVLARHAEEEQFLHLLRQARPGWLLVAVLLQLATYLCDGVLWQRVLRHTGVRAPMWGLARLSLMKLTFDQLIPTAGIGGSMMVARGLRKVGAAPGAAAAAILMTLLCFYAAQALSVGWSLADLWSHEEMDALVQWMATAFSGVAMAVFVLDAATLGVLVRALGESTSLGTVFASFMMASVAQTVSFIPGGVGTFEAASVAMLSFLGLPVEAALTATLLLRGFTLWLPLLPGFYLLRWSLPGNKRQEDH